jgi:hypothetical protein
LYQQRVQVHLFKHPIREGLLEPKKKRVRDYFKAAGSSSDDAAKLEEEAYGVRPTCDREPALSRYDRFICSRVPPPGCYLLYSPPCVILLALSLPQPQPPPLLSPPIVSLFQTRAHTVCSSGARSAPDPADGNKAAAADSQAGLKSMMHIDVELRGASKVSRTSSDRVMDGVIKTKDVYEQRHGHGPLIRALRRSRDTGESFGAMVCKTTKHSTCRRRLAIAAEVRARVHA